MAITSARWARSLDIMQFEDCPAGAAKKFDKSLFLQRFFCLKDP